MAMKYAGIGSRETPAPMRQWMTTVAGILRQRGYLLRSGAAKGADRAFEAGAGGHCEIFRARDATPEAFDLAAKYHPYWERCNAISQQLHARNGLIVLGAHLDDPVDFVLCWTKDGQASGGTGQAIRLASAYRIPIVNVRNANALEQLSRMLGT